MTTQSTETPYRLPPMMVAACLISLAAFYLSSGGSVLLPFFALSLIISQFTRVRVDSMSAAGIFLRIAGIAIVAIASNGRETKLVDAFVFAPALDFVTHAFAAEMAVEPWLAWRLGPGHSRMFVFLSTMVFFGGCATNFPVPMIAIAPVYFLCLTLGMRQYTSQARGIGSIGRLLAGTLGIGLMLAIGSTAQYEFRIHKDEITNFGLERFGPMARGRDHSTSGIEKNPHLTSTFDIAGSSTRLLRIDGEIDDPHLHGMSYDNYAQGRWRPDLENRRYVPVSAAEINANAAGRRVNVLRYAGDDGMVSAPLASAGIRLPESATGGAAGAYPVIDMDRAALRAGDELFQYAIIPSGHETHQGPMAAPLAASDRARYLQTPHDIAPALRTLTAQVAPRTISPKERAAAIVAFLGRNNQYATKAHIGVGDPVSTFVLLHRSAHCEYFGSAAAIMLRIADVPSRYVIGYYAHERNSAGELVVRGQDAHAWCEAWIDGTGWVTVDATPAGGRPDQTAQDSPLWHIRDLWQDLVAWFQMRAANDGTMGRTIAIIALLLLAGGYAAYQYVLARRRRNAALVYAAADKQFTEFAARFSRLLDRRGAPVPPAIPWGDHIATLSENGSVDTAAASRFVEAYTAARFGDDPPSAETANRLRDLLAELERPVSKAKSKSDNGR
ncbi:MAG TPA: transglutaminase domain-containing protein [Capsulimonadaceae bacterium]|jgi:transglutaminase-like putative cysteine protease